MRVLMTADTVGGVWTYALDLARALSAHDVDVQLATMGANLSEDQWEAARSIANLTIHESVYKLEWMENPWDDVRDSGRWLRDLEQKLQPDLVHLNGYAHGALDFAAPKIVVAHSCVCSWWRAVKHEEAPSSWDRYRAEVSAGLREADMVVAPSRFMMACLEECYRPVGKKTVIPNGRDASMYHAAEKQDFILAAGRIWDEAKNVSALTDIAKDVEWNIKIAGEDKHPDQREDSSHEREFVDARDSRGYVCLGKLSAPQLAEVMSRASIYVLPARYEPFGLSILEAALSGCALVLGDIASLRENWYDAAAFVEPEDHAALAKTINTLIDSRERREDLARRARLRAKYFSLERMGDRYFSLYQQMVGSAHPTLLTSRIATQHPALSTQH